MKIKKQPKEMKLPAIWMHDGAGQYACKIGYRIYDRPSGRVRDRAFQLLGTDYEEAVRKMLALVKDWRWTVEFFKTSRAGEKPVWLEEKIMRGYQAAERGDGLNYGHEHGLIIDGGDEPGQPSFEEQLAQKRRESITLAEGIQRFLDHYKSRVGLAAGKGVKLYSYLSFKYDLDTVLRQIDGQTALSRLTRGDLERFVNYWLKLPNGISVRTAVNYCKRLKQVLDWLADEETLDFVKPRGTDRLFRFRNYNPIHIEPFTPDEMKKLFGVMPERVRLYLQLAINCGYYQSDIATLRWEHLVTIESGIEKPVRNIAELTGDLFITRRRQKTLHQSNLVTLCYVWPENVELLRKFAAKPDNEHGLVLLNDEGRPLMDGGKTNNISERFHKYKHSAGLTRKKVEFKQFRKTGATWMENNVGEQVARMYAAHNMPGELKRYAAQSFEPLTAALKLWGEELRAAGVL